MKNEINLELKVKLEILRFRKWSKTTVEEWGF